MPKNNNKLSAFLDIWCNDIKNSLYNGDAGLQFSINSTNDDQREYMFSGNSMKLEDIAHEAAYLPKPKGRKYTLNFALADDYEVDANKLATLFSPEYFMVKLTPLHKTQSCDDNRIITTNGYDAFTPYKKAEEDLKIAGFDVIVFIPSYDEDLGLITCGNAILSGSIPKVNFIRVI